MRRKVDRAQHEDIPEISGRLRALIERVESLHPACVQNRVRGVEVGGREGKAREEREPEQRQGYAPAQDD